MEPELSDRAVDCFAHGVAHLLDELGAEAGLSKGIGVLRALADGEPSPLLIESDSAQSSTVPATESEVAPEPSLAESALEGSS
jgi:hypothetical protein